MKTGKSILTATTILFISTAILFTACKKDSNSSSSSSTTDNSSAASLSANGASADNMYDDALNVTLQTGDENSLNSIVQHSSGTTTNGVSGNTVLGAYYCASVTISPMDTMTYPKTVTVDFGTGCTSTDGVVRSGSITYTLSERFRNPGATISATFSNYKVNGYALAGTYSVTNNSSVSAGIAYTTAVTNGMITYPNDTAYSFSGTKTVTQTAGIGSTDFSSYAFSVTGGYAIGTSYGESITATVTTPLVKEETCKYIVSGIESFTYKKSAITIKGTFDYGNGSCDSLATVTIGGVASTVSLH